MMKKIFYLIRDRIGFDTILFAVLFLLLFRFIFGFSAQTGVQSSGISDRIATWLSDWLHQQFSLSVEQEMLTFPIRKAAHMSEYALLWMDSFAMFYSLSRHQSFWRGRRGFVTSILLVFLVSCSDEIHQLFVPGRSGQLIDVGWDMLGVTLCILGCWLLYCLVRRCRRS